MSQEKISICSKCGYKSSKNKEKSGIPLCKVCFLFSPDDPEKLDEYVKEKIPSESLESFRKYYNFSKNKDGMIKKASNGNLMTRPPFGYKQKIKKS